MNNQSGSEWKEFAAIFKSEIGSINSDRRLMEIVDQAYLNAKTIYEARPRRSQPEMNNQSGSDLKPCPFCGHNAKFKSGIFSGSDEKNHLGNIHCNNCYASTGGDLQIFDEAIEKWNTRVQPKPKNIPEKGLERVNNEMEHADNECCVKYIDYAQTLHDEIIQLKKDKRDLESHLESLRVRLKINNEVYQPNQESGAKPDTMTPIEGKKELVPLDETEIGCWINNYTWNHPLKNQEGATYNLITHREGMELAKSICKQFGTLPPPEIDEEKLIQIIRKDIVGLSAIACWCPDGEENSEFLEIKNLVDNKFSRLAEKLATAYREGRLGK